jgi:5-methylcytosine-specific restriction enzyme subunit McrC
MRSITRVGLYRAYVEKAEQGSHLQGRLDLPAQLRQGPARKEQIHSRYEDLTTDLPCNQAPRAIAERLLSSTGLEDRVAVRLREGLSGWEGIRSRPPLIEELNRLAEEPVREDYRLLSELCVLLWQALAPGVQPGNTPSPTFLLDLERVFERYLTRGLLEAFRRPGWQALAQQSCPISLPVPDQPDLVIRPDVLVLREERPVLVVDAKWKRLKKGQPETDDLYQMLAYCTGLGIPRAALVYPGKRDSGWTYRMRATAVEVEVHTLTVTASPARCRRSLHCLARILEVPT